MELVLFPSGVVSSPLDDSPRLLKLIGPVVSEAMKSLADASRSETRRVMRNGEMTYFRHHDQMNVSRL